MGISALSAEISGVFSEFAIDGQLLNALPLLSGHINDTYLAEYRTAGGIERFVHQRINPHVFHQPEAVMDNIVRVTEFARQQLLASGIDPTRRVLTVIPTWAGGSFNRTASGEVWRTYRYIEGARTYEVSSQLGHLYQAARAFGNFACLLDALPGARLHETIPGFHDTPRRYAALLQAIQADIAGRVRDCSAEIDFLLERQQAAAQGVNGLRSGDLPERITHNDTKLNNVLIDDQTGEGICVLDLDTVMPGSILYDFGDLIRMGAAAAAEDEADLTAVDMDMSKFRVLAQGFVETTRSLLIPFEVDLLPFAPRLITCEQAVRFLTDHLNGDVYYKTQRPAHNLIRARNQIKMVEAMEAAEEAMREVVSGVSG